MRKVKLHLDYAGYCWAKESHALKGASSNDIQFMALWGLIKHPDHGYILMDTGYTRRFYKSTQKYPNKIYSLLTKVVVNADDEIISKLADNGIHPKEIKKVIITHFHADHIGGLKDFPNAEIITSKKGYEYAMRISKYISFAKGVLKDLLPDDINKRVCFVEDCKPYNSQSFDRAWDLFGDDSIIIYDMPGHARGQFGLGLSTQKNDYLFVADAIWLSQTYQNYILPPKLISLFIDSWSAYKSTVKLIREYVALFPNHLIIPTHCKKTTDALISKTIDFEKL